MQNAKTWWTPVCGVLLVAILSGCGGGGDETAASSANLAAGGPAVVYGTVIDEATHKGIGAATITLYVAQSPRTETTVADDPATTTIDETGEFSLTNVPFGTHRLHVGADGFATYETWVTINPPSASTYYAPVNGTGKVALGRGCTVEVYVTAEGTPIPEAAVFATGNYGLEIAGVTDTSGHATLAGLAQNSSYSLIVPSLDRAPDGSKDGVYDFLTTSFYGGGSNNYTCVHSAKTVAMDLVKAERDDSLSVIAGSYERFHRFKSNYVTLNAVGPGQDLQLIFSYPVQIDALVMKYANAPFASEPSAVSVPVEVTTAAGGTLLKIHPTSTPPINATLHLNGTLSAVVNGETRLYVLDTSEFADWYVFEPAPLVESSPITADNSNGQTGKAEKSGTVYLEFPERVYGTAIVVGYTKSGQATSLANGYSFNLEGDYFAAVVDIVRDAAVGGCTEGTCGGNAAHYRIALPSSAPTFEDHRADSPNLVELVIDAIDADGHRMTKTVTLPVE